MWRLLKSFEGGLEREADALLAKKRQYDSDVWVLEIEDAKGLYKLDALVSSF